MGLERQLPSRRVQLFLLWCKYTSTIHLLGGPVAAFRIRTSPGEEELATGWINHDAIIVTASSIDRAEAAQAKAKELGLPCSDLVHSPANGYVSLLSAPDGYMNFLFVAAVSGWFQKWLSFQ